MSYDPTIAEWTTEDPTGYVDGMNLYQLEKSNPIKYVDPKGEGIVDCLKSLWNLVSASATVEKRLSEIVIHGSNPDAGHIKALQQAVDRMNDAKDKVEKHCSCVAGAAAAIAAAAALAKQAADLLAQLLQQLEQEPILVP